MKDRVREAVFNLVGTHAKGMHAVDLFAGTGALGFEAISRGADPVTFIEQHFPTAQTIRQNAAVLGISERVQVFPANVFLWNPPEACRPTALGSCSVPRRIRSSPNARPKYWTCSID